MLTRVVCIGVAILVIAGVAENAYAFKANRAARPGYIIGFGQDENGKSSRPPDGNDFVAISAGKATNIALRTDGSVVTWGADVGEYRDDVYIAVVVGAGKCIALRADHSIAQLVGTGGVPAGNNFVQISSGGTPACALRSDGTIVQWDVDDVPQDLNHDFVAVECGNYMAYGLKSDGTVIGWGSNALDEQTHLNSCGTQPDRCAVDPWFVPANWTVATNPTVQIAAGRYIFMFIRADGTLVTGGRTGTSDMGYPPGCMGVVPDCYDWGWWQWPVNTKLPLDTNPVTNPLSTGWIQVAPGGHHNLALRRVNGRNEMVLWGEGAPGYVDVPSTVPMPGYGGRPALPPTDEPQAVASGFYHSLAIIHRYPEGDVNRDDKVDFIDFAALAAKWLDNNIQPAGGLVSWYKFDESSGTTAADSSSNGHDGTLIETSSGGFIWDSGGRFAGALRFDGDGPSNSTNPCPRVAVPAADISPKAGTLSFWMNLTNPKPADKSSRAGKLYFFSAIGLAGDDKISMWIDTPANILFQVGSYSYGSGTASYVFTRGQWYHVALTWDHDSNLLGKYQVYINGSVVAPPSGNGTFTGLASLTSAHIGNNLTSPYVQSMHGSLDDVRIYDYALPAGDIALTYGGVLPDAISRCLGSPEMDLSGDCRVDFADLVLIIDNWLK